MAVFHFLPSASGSEPNGATMLDDKLPAIINDDQVLPEPQAAKVCGFSQYTLRRRVQAGDGPKRIQLSPRRFGCRMRDLREWLNSRVVQS
jgi:predicted DNA-binding transcriptional regulator AlpA